MFQQFNPAQWICSYKNGKMFIENAAFLYLNNIDRK